MPPRRLQPPPPQASSRLQPPAGTDPLPILFSFYHCQRGPHGFDTLSAADQRAVATMLYERRAVTWSEARAAPRHGLGFEKIPAHQLPALPAGLTADTTFLAMRFSGRKPLVGFRTGQVFHIVWFDGDFTLYDHGD